MKDIRTERFFVFFFEFLLILVCSRGVIMLKFLENTGKKCTKLEGDDEKGKEK